MTDRLQHALALIEQLPPELQDAAAEQLEAWAEPHQAPQTPRPKKSFAGIWRDRTDMDDMIDELDRLRHASTPTPPITDDDL